MKKSNISFLLADDVYTICRPLFQKFNLNAFSYSKIYKDGSRTELWTDPRAMEYSFFEKKHIGKFYTPQYMGKDRIVIYEKKIITYPSVIRNTLENQLADQKYIFNHDNALLISEFKDEIWEFFFFYTTKENINAINTYLSNIEELKKFCNYFKKRAGELIKYADNDKLISGHKKVEEIFRRQSRINNLIRLTKRENEIGYMISEGKTAKDISEIFSLSSRTVEHHISNMKEKFNVRRKSDLIKLLLANQKIELTN